MTEQTDMKAVFSNLTEAETLAVYRFLAQAVDNERNNEEDDPYEGADLSVAEGVVGRLELALAALAWVPA